MRVLSTCQGLHTLHEEVQCSKKKETGIPDLPSIQMGSA